MSLDYLILTVPSAFSYTYIHVPSTWGPSWSCQYAIIDCSFCFLLHLYTCTPNVGAVVVVSICNYWLLLLFSLTLIYMYPQRGGRRGRVNMQLLTAPSVFSYTYIHVPPTWGPSWSYQYAIIDCSVCFLLHLYTCTPNVGAVVVASICNYWLLLLFSLTFIYMYPQHEGRRGRVNMQLLTAPSVISYTYIHAPATWGPSWSYQYAIIDCSFCFLLHLYTCTRNVGAVVVASICNYWLLLLFSLTLIYMYPQRGGRRGRINMQLLTAPPVFFYTYIHVPPTWGPSWSYQYTIMDCSFCFLLHLYTCTPNL
jgi:branched-subunit amino acid transport protein